MSAAGTKGTKTQRDQLLQRAVVCYERAAWPDEACRVLEALGELHRAARGHEGQGRFARAAELYQRAAEGAEAAADAREKLALTHWAWLDAARCYLRAGLPAAAASALERTDDVLGAAWVLVELARRVARAEALLARAWDYCPQEELDEPDLSPADGVRPQVRGARDPSVGLTERLAWPLALDLVRARCALARRRAGEAVSRLAQVVASLGELPRAGGPPLDDAREEALAVLSAHVAPPSPGTGAAGVAAVTGAALLGRRVEAWALVLAERLARPDLAALTHAAAVRAGVRGAAGRWRRWAEAALGDARGVPPDAAEEEGPLPPPWPEWFARLPEAERPPWPCPGLRFGDAAGEYVSERTGTVLVWVPPGDFVMGSGEDDREALDWERPQHRHPMPEGYWIGRDPATWGQYLAYCAATGRAAPERPGFATTDEHPVVNVSWDDAAAYCAWAGLALPSEPQWEKAARGPDGRRYPWGEQWDASRCNSRESGVGGTTPVGSYPLGVSPYGARDLVGNVVEWCQDSWDPAAYARYASGELAAPAGSSNRVSRGGSGWNDPGTCRSASRGRLDPGRRVALMGFRPALDARAVVPSYERTPHAE